MKINLYQVDAFADKLFSGNPAAVCPLEEWLPDEVLQNIAAENNLSETAFFVKQNNYYHLRWFTPTIEVDLCGHATLASGYVLFNILNVDSDEIVFESLSGKLEVSRERDLISLNFPARRPQKIELTNEHLRCINFKPIEAHYHTKLLLLLNSEEEVNNAVADFEVIKLLKSDGLIITATGNEVDFVSRYFAPHAGIPEDPVTGSAHTVLTPFWSKRIGKKRLFARQLSKRGGDLTCEDLGDRIKISGTAILYLKGEIEI